jgi:hypothetical protein
MSRLGRVIKGFCAKCTKKRTLQFQVAKDFVSVEQNWCATLRLRTSLQRTFVGAAST